jgi:hypothetical protein
MSPVSRESILIQILVAILMAFPVSPCSFGKLCRKEGFGVTEIANRDEHVNDPNGMLHIYFQRTQNRTASKASQTGAP